MPFKPLAGLLDPGLRRGTIRFNPRQHRIDLHLRASLGVQFHDHAVEWRDQPMLHLWSTAEDTLRMSLASWAKRFKSPDIKAVPTDFHAQGGFGLYVRNGRISFRNVSVELLRP